jgi:hypothetical protein
MMAVDSVQGQVRRVINDAISDGAVVVRAAHGRRARGPGAGAGKHIVG